MGTRESNGAETGECRKRWRAEVQRFRETDEPFPAQLEAYRTVFREWPAEAGPPPAWAPSAEHLHGSNAAGLAAEAGVADHQGLHRWSVEDRGRFWEVVLARMGVPFRTPPARILDPEGGPEHPRWLPGARLSAVDACFTADPGRTAIVAAGEERPGLVRLSYGELRDRVARFAAGLRAHRLGAGARVALYMPMNVESVIAYLGAVWAGAAVVSIADSFAAGEAARRLQIGGAAAVVTVDGYRRAGRTLSTYRRAVEAGAPRAIVIHTGRPPTLRPGDLTWREVADGPGGFSGEATPPGHLTNVLFSSGTTGDPKAIPWTQLTPLKCAMDGRYHQDIRPSDVVAWPTNIGWMMGPWLIYASLINGATMALYDGAPNREGFTRFVRDAGVTVLGVVPSLVRAWRRQGAGDGWSRIRVFSSTGEPSGEEDYLWLMSRAGYRAPVIEYCGGTEIGGGYVTGTVLRPASPATFSTPALGLDMVVLDEAGAPAAPGEAGEVFLAPPSIGLSQSLLNRDHHRVYFAGCPQGPGGAVLRRHGDLLAPLGGGYFRAAGRADDTMNLGGIKVASREIEAVLAGHPAVVECAAVGVAPEGGGPEGLVVFLVPAGRERPADPAALQAELDRRLAARLNPLFRIGRLAFVEELPRTASGKVMRRVLRRRAEPGPDGP